MNSYITGSTIKELREHNKMTQKQLAELLLVSDKTISKWETGKGYPDITQLEPLSRCLKVSVAGLLSGECITNENRSANMLKTRFYVCPICGNVITSIGQGAFSCCGITLPVQEEEEIDTDHEIHVSRVENDYYITMKHAMTKEHYISFIAYLTSNRVQLVKQYPEQTVEVRFPVDGHGIIYAYCNQHGLLKVRV